MKLKLILVRDYNQIAINIKSFTQILPKVNEVIFLT